VGKKVYLAISNKNSLVKKYVKAKTSMFEVDKLNLDLVDEFSFPREKLSTIQNSSRTYDLNVSTLLVGKIVKDQKNPLHSGAHAVSGKAIPFDLKYIVHYHAKTGEVLATRELK